MLSFERLMRVLLISSQSDPRKRWRFVEAALQAANVDCLVMPIEKALDPSISSGQSPALPDICILFHGGARTAHRIRQLRRILGCQVVLRLGGRSDISAMDRARGALRKAKLVSAAAAFANLLGDSRTIRLADGCICVAEPLGAWTAQKSGKPVFVAPPIRPSLQQRSPSAQSTKSRSILTIANLRYRAKASGLLRLLPLFEQLAQSVGNVSWRIAGDASRHRDVLEQLRSSPAAENIHYLGWLEDVQSELSNANQFWYASALDAYPLSISEALWSGVPVLAFEGQSAAAMLPPKDPVIAPEAWLQRSLRLLEDSEYHKSTASTARHHVAEIECAKTVGFRLHSWLESLL